MLDVKLPDVDGLQLISPLKELSPEAEILIMTGFGSVNQSVEAIRMGAADYVLKPFNLDELFMRMERLLEMRQVRERLSFYSDKMRANLDQNCVQGPNREMGQIF